MSVSLKYNIRDISLIYNVKQISMLDIIKRMIENNYNLIYDCLDKTKIIDISGDESNFNDTFYYIINGLYNTDEMRKIISDKEFISILYMEILSRKNNYSSDLFNSNTKMHNEMLSSLIALNYFNDNGTFNEFVEYLKVRNKEKEIFKWFQNKYRWEAYNYLINDIFDYHQSNDELFSEQLDYLISYRNEQKVDIFSKKDNCDFDQESQSITPQEFYSLFYEFLNYINAPVEWFNIFNNLKENNLIIFEDKDNKYKTSECFLDKDGIQKIFIKNGASLMGFCVFVHEFIHCISMTISGYLYANKISVSEFPSIFFERIASNFLVEKGYSSEIINQVKNSRNSNNNQLYNKILPLLIDLCRYINYGKIDKNDKVQLYQKEIDMIIKSRKKLIKRVKRLGLPTEGLEDLSEFDIDINEETDKECDCMIDLCLKQGTLAIDGYQYLIGTHLTELLLEKMKEDDSVISNMIYVTNNLKDLDTKRILSLLNIEDAFNSEPQNNDNYSYTMKI